MDSTMVGLIVGIVLVIITVILIFWGRNQETARIDGARRSEVKASPPPEMASAAPAVPAKKDDLTIIEGIGPKIASILQQSGITSFSQLAAAEIPTLEKLLAENKLQFSKPGSWPEQARLAAEGKMDELKALQDQLTAGR
jgi:predicted flap endonuclease-1-like 5' DNA nuclease